MGNGASTASAVGVKASVAVATVDELKATFALLSAEEKAKMSSALSPTPAKAPAERVSHLMEQRQIWNRNEARFNAWLDQTVEAPLEPELPIVDAHHHIWDMRALKGFNMFGMFKQQYYMADELVDDFVGGGHNVTHTVFVTTHAFFTSDPEPKWMAPLGEVAFVQGIAAQFASGTYGTLRCAAAIIGTADFAKYGAAVEPLLLACKAASPSYRGIRCNAAHDTKLKSNFHPTPGMYNEDTFREGFALLHKHGLVFDAFVFGSQLADIHSLAQAFPETTIVLNHAGAPVAALGNVEGAPEYDGKQAEIVASWKEAMKRIADECPNVVVKIGGFVIPQLGLGLEGREAPAGSEELAELLRGLFSWTVETFGCARSMLEGNFPVDKVSVSYTTLWNAYKRLTTGLPEADRALLFSGTAKRVYRI